MPRCSAISFHMLSGTTGAQAHLNKRPIRSRPRTRGVECLSCVAPEACSVLSGGCTFPRLYNVRARMYASHVAIAYLKTRSNTLPCVFKSLEEFAAARAKGLLFSAPVPPEQVQSLSWWVCCFTAFRIGHGAVCLLLRTVYTTY